MRLKKIGLQNIKKMNGEDSMNEKQNITKQTGNVVKKGMFKGISVGCCLAMIISFVTHKSVLWALIHGLLGWFYVIYYIIMY